MRERSPGPAAGLSQSAVKIDEKDGCMMESRGSDMHAEFRLASDPDTDVDVLTRLAGHPDAIIRAAIASNGGTPAAVWTGLQADRDPLVTEAIARRIEDDRIEQIADRKIKAAKHV